MGAWAGQRRAPPPPRHPAAGLPAVVVHRADQAAAALAAAGPRGVLLLSVPGAAGSLGPAWFLALVARAAAAEPEARHWVAALDCGDAPGHALAALRAGARLLILSPTCPAWPAVAAAAAEAGAALWPERPPAELDLATLDLRRPGGRQRLAQWLAGPPGDNPATLG